MNETAWQALEIMWKGMVSIFAVILVLTLLVYLITKFVKDPEKKTDD
ncbi:MAG: sodium pump decarboxylase gamma subunit [Lachnospiraceae bacterium]|nr:sodium pump decarboxylase gamma subunit [Lachnospiraceae bacterium]